MSTPPPIPSAGVLAAARTHAKEMRAEWVLRIHRQQVTVHEAIAHATTHEGRPLLALGLTRLLSAQKSWSRAHADRALVHIHTTLDMPLPPLRERSRLTVKWLIDGRTGGRRLLALADFQTPLGKPYPGFPFATMPTVVTHSIASATTRRGISNVHSAS